MEKSIDRPTPKGKDGSREEVFPVTTTVTTPRGENGGMMDAKRQVANNNDSVGVETDTGFFPFPTVVVDDDFPLKATRIKKHGSRIEITSNGRGFVWRSGSGSNRTSTYGGSIGALEQSQPDRYKQYVKRHNKNVKAKSQKTKRGSSS